MAAVHSKGSVILHAEKHPDTGKAYEKIYRRKVGDPDPTKCNKNCILALINGLKNKLDVNNTVIFIHKKKANPNNTIHRYLFLHIFYREWGRYQPQMGGWYPPFFFYSKNIKSGQSGYALRTKLVQSVHKGASLGGRWWEMSIQYGVLYGA